MCVDLTDFSSYLTSFNKSFTIMLVNPYLLYVGVSSYLSKYDFNCIFNACPSNVDFTLNSNSSNSGLLFTFYISLS